MNIVNEMELNMKQKTYKLHTDPGHGWLAVRRKELVELGIADKITRYSYVKGETAYLEEDCDLATFFTAYRAKHGVDPVYTESFREKTFVRNCEPYSVDTTITIQAPKTTRRYSVLNQVRQARVIKVPTKAMMELTGAQVEVSEELTTSEARKIRDAWNRKHAHLSYDGK